MFSLAKLWVDIGVNDKPLRGQLNATRGMLGGAGASLGKLFAVGAGAFGAVKVGEGIFNSIQGAMDLGETLSKIGVVFGPAAAKVTAQTDAMAERFGIAKQETLDAASVFGLMAQGAGMGADASAEFSNQMTKLAADAMSFYNVPLPEALDKIRAGLSGESEPLRAFGVFLTEAAVKNEALRMGLVRSGEDLTEGQKIMARSSLIMAQMGAAQGDLERTAASPANAQKRLVGSIQNSMADFGNAVMPMWAGMLDVASSALSGITGWLQSNAETFSGWVGMVAEGYGVVGVMVRNFGAVWQTVGLTVQERLINMGELVEWFVGAAGQYLDWFGRNWVTIFTDAMNAVWTVFQNLGRNIQGLWQAVLDFFRTGQFHFDGKPLLDGFKATVEALPEVAAPHLTSLQDEISKVWDGVAEKEAERATRGAAAGVASRTLPGGPAGAGAAETESAKAKERASTMSLESFAQKLQQGVFGDAGTARRHLAATDKSNELLTRIADKVGVGAGAGLVAVAAP